MLETRSLLKRILPCIVALCFGLTVAVTPNPAFSEPGLEADAPPNQTVHAGEIPAASAPSSYTLIDAPVIAVDWSKAATQFVTMGGSRTFTFSNPWPDVHYMLVVTQDTTGSRRATWPDSVRWPGGRAPTLTATAGRRDYIGFIYNGVSSTYDAISVSQDY